jgi:hypothetical protein
MAAWISACAGAYASLTVAQIVKIPDGDFRCRGMPTHPRGNVGFAGVLQSGR